MSNDSHPSKHPDEIVINPEVHEAWERVAEAARSAPEPTPAETCAAGSISIGAPVEPPAWEFTPKPASTFASAPASLPDGPRGSRFSWSSWLLSLLFVPPAIALLYALAGYLLVPRLIQGRIAQALAVQAGWRAEVEGVTCNPFTLNLRFQGLRLSPSQLPASEKAPVRCREVEIRLDPGSLFRRALLCRRVVVSEPEIRLKRGADGSYNLFPRRAGQGREKPPTPAWSRLPFAIGALELRGGSLLFEDQPTGREHLISAVDLQLPGIGSIDYPGEPGVAPSLKALVNGAEISMIGTSRRDHGDNIGSVLSLELHDLRVADYLAYLPGLPETVNATGGEADLQLELTFTNDASGWRLEFLGNGEAHDLRLENDRQPFLAIPALSVTFKGEPLKQRLRIEELTLNRPELAFSAPVRGLATRLGRLVASADGPALAVDSLIVDSGGISAVNSGGKPLPPWRGLALSLRGFATRSFSGKEAQPKANLELQFGEGEGQLRVKAGGNLDQDLLAGGTFVLNDLDLPMYWPAGEAKRAPGRGRVRMEGRFDLDLAPEGDAEGFVPRLSGATVLVSDLEFGKEDSSFVYAPELRLNDTTIDPRSRSIQAGSMLLDRATVYQRLAKGETPLFGLLEKIAPTPADEGWDLALGAIESRHATLRLVSPAAHAQLKDKAGTWPPEFKDVDFTLGKAAIAAKGREVKLSAGLGEQGTLRVNGAYNPTSRVAALAIELDKAGVGYLGGLVDAWLVPRLDRGLLALKGSLSLPEMHFQGSIRLDDLEASLQGKEIAVWRSAEAGGVEMDLAPFTFSAELLKVVAPRFTIPLGAGFVDQYLRTGAMPRLQLKTIELEGANLTLSRPSFCPDYQPRLTGVSARLNGFTGADSVVAYHLRGSLEGKGELEIDGRGSLRQGSGEARLRIASLPMAALKKAPAPPSGLDLEGATVSLRRGPGQDGGTVTELDFLNPRASGPELSRVVAMLRDERGAMGLRLEEEKGAALPLADGIARLLRRYEVKAELSPFLLFAEGLPGLALSEAVDFTPGESNLGPEAQARLANFLELLRRRPLLRLELRPGFDPRSDHEVLRQRLQRVEDDRAEAENQRRTELRRRRDEEAARRRAAIAANPNAVITEVIVPDDKREDLSPVSPVQVEVDPALLDELAGKRASTVLKYLVWDHGVPSERVKSGAVNSQGAGVWFGFDG